jgi:hypothetical protein
VLAAAGTKLITRERFEEHKALLLIALIGTIATLGIVPYHRAVARAECRQLYGQAHSWQDTLQIDAETVVLWDRFPDLAKRWLFSYQQYTVIPAAQAVQPANAADKNGRRWATTDHRVSQGRLQLISIPSGGRGAAIRTLLALSRRGLCT